METQPPRQVRFGSFEADLDARELRKGGLKVKLQDQPFQILTLLLERSGKIVTRDELRQKLWPADTFVDFDRGLNTAVNKLRETLDDSATHPRYVETVARRGYRFIAPIESLAEAAPVGPAPPGTELRRSRLIPSVAVVSFLAILALAFSKSPITRKTQTPLRRFSYTVPGTVFFVPGNAFFPAISPDGRMIAYFGGGAEPRLWIQHLDREQPRDLRAPGVGWNSGLFWSPGSDSIGFTDFKQLLSSISVTGNPTTICPLKNSTFWGAAWSPDGNSIIFSSGSPARLYEAPARGGDPKPVLTFRASDDLQFMYPHFLPLESEERSLVLAVSRGMSPAEIAILSLDTGRWQTLDARGVRPVYSRTGHIVYECQRPGDLPGVWALPFSLQTRKARGEPFVVSQRAGSPSVAEDGTLVYLSVPAVNQTRLVWRDRNGKYIGQLDPPHSGISEPALSPDGRFIALSSGESGNPDIWIHDIARGVRTRLTSDPGDDSRPMWSPDGKEIAFSREHTDLRIFPADGSGKERVLLDSSARESIEDWSRDGNYIVYYVHGPGNRMELWWLQRSGNSGGYEPKPFLQGPFHQAGARFSPDGRFLAYCSNESGAWEVYVRSFPDGGSKSQVSGRGGTQPRWSRDGKELFYVEGDMLTAVAVTTRPAFSVRSTRRLFRHANLRYTGVPSTRYDVSLDGQRFLLIEPVETAPSSAIRVVQNWFAEFERLERRR